MNNKQEKEFAKQALGLLVVDLGQSFDGHPKYTGYSERHREMWLMVAQVLGQEETKKLEAFYQVQLCIEENA